MIFTLALTFTLSFFNAQNSSKSNSQSTAIQADLLVNTWYESPKESSANTIVYKLQEYTVIVGQDYFNFQPGKISFDKSKTFTSNFFKTSISENPNENLSGKWSITNNQLTLKVGTNSKIYTIVSIEKDKLVLKIN